jgi:hypothetical protein
MTLCVALAVARVDIKRCRVIFWDLGGQVRALPRSWRRGFGSY